MPQICLKTGPKLGFGSKFASKWPPGGESTLPGGKMGKMGRIHPWLSAESERMRVCVCESRKQVCVTTVEHARENDGIGSQAIPAAHEAAGHTKTF